MSINDTQKTLSPSLLETASEKNKDLIVKLFRVLGIADLTKDSTDLAERLYEEKKYQIGVLLNSYVQEAKEDAFYMGYSAGWDAHKEQETQTSLAELENAEEDVLKNLTLHLAKQMADEAIAYLTGEEEQEPPADYDYVDEDSLPQD